MWLLCRENEPEQCYALWPPDSTFTVGRLGVDFCFSSDRTISRRHAEIRVSRIEDGTLIRSTTSDSKLFSSHRPTVSVLDLGSTYGTYVGDNSIATSGGGSQVDRIRNKVTLSDDTPIRFGLGPTVIRLQWRPMVCCSSSLKFRAVLDDSLRSVQLPTMESAFGDRTSHVVMPEIILTVKALNALSAGLPIVTPLFISDFVQSVKSRQCLPLVDHYVPELGETSVVHATPKVDCRPSSRRQSLFADKIFLFDTPGQCEKYESAIKLCSGEVRLVSQFGADNVLSVNIILIQSTMPSAQYKTVSQLYRCAGFNVVPEIQIGLAILKASCVDDCNPLLTPTVTKYLDMSTRKLGQPGEILAHESQTLWKDSQASVISNDLVMADRGRISAAKRKAHDDASHSTLHQSLDVVDEQWLDTLACNSQYGSKKMRLADDEHQNQDGKISACRTDRQYCVENTVVSTQSQRGQHLAKQQKTLDSFFAKRPKPSQSGRSQREPDITKCNENHEPPQLSASGMSRVAAKFGSQLDSLSTFRPLKTSTQRLSASDGDDSDDETYMVSATPGTQATVCAVSPTPNDNVPASPSSAISDSLTGESDLDAIVDSVVNSTELQLELDSDWNRKSTATTCSDRKRRYDDISFTRQVSSAKRLRDDMSKTVFISKSSTVVPLARELSAARLDLTDSTVCHCDVSIVSLSISDHPTPILNTETTRADNVVNFKAFRSKDISRCSWLHSNSFVKVATSATRNNFPLERSRCDNEGSDDNEISHTSRSTSVTRASTAKTIGRSPARPVFGDSFVGASNNAAKTMLPFFGKPKSTQAQTDNYCDDDMWNFKY